jgi:hypothetical protein
MKFAVTHIIAAITVGLGAALFMDLWALFLKRTFNISSLNYCFVGRWLLHMPEGIFKHESIATAPRKSGECTVGWFAHYAIGPSSRSHSFCWLLPNGCNSRLSCLHYLGASLRSQCLSSSCSLLWAGALLLLRQLIQCKRDLAA